eukprot:TRINITY_DN7793_c2_g1_i1.p1 TRINITY_DN7793_c2_g1~~TRINITY_DN7793_c2_g1_i1.p1  ORF type:complete len:702 (+),score=164.59 TRINITY_DN7793_c2_g1_i1:37-2142(+)
MSDLVQSDSLTRWTFLTALLLSKHEKRTRSPKGQSPKPRRPAPPAMTTPPSLNRGAQMIQEPTTLRLESPAESPARKHGAATQCPECGNTYASDSKFCRKCGKPRVATECPDCGNHYAADSKYCRKCGRPRAEIGLDQAMQDNIKLEFDTSAIPIQELSTTEIVLDTETRQTPTTRASSTIGITGVGASGGSSAAGLGSDFADTERHMDSIIPGSLQSTQILTTSDIARQHYEWSTELETVDQKQASLIMVQWKMIRDQTGMLAQQLIELRKELEFVKGQSMGTASRMDQFVQDNKGIEARLGKVWRQSHDRLADDVSKARNALAQDMKVREANEAALLRRLDSVEAKLSASLPKLDREVNDLRTALEGPLSQLPKFKDQLRQHVEEWKNGHLMVMEHSTKLHDGLNKGLREMMLAHENHKSDMHQNFTHHRGLFDQGLGQLRDSMHARFSEMPTSHHDDHGSKARLQELEDKIMTVSREMPRHIDAKLKEKESKHGELERSLEHLAASLAQESQARHSMAEVFEQMLKAEATKLNNTMIQKAACARLDCKEIQRSLTDMLTKETSDRQEGDVNIKQDLTGICENLGDRVHSVEGEFSGLHQTCSSTQASVRNFEVQLRALEQNLEACLQALRTEVRSSLDKERLQRELSDTTIADQVDFLEGFHKHMREFYISRGSPPEVRYEHVETHSIDSGTSGRNNQ